MNSNADPRQEQQTASQRFAALAGLDWSGPSHQQRIEFDAWIAAGNAQHAATAAGRTPAQPDDPQIGDPQPVSNYSPPRVLDASAIVELFHGHPMLMQLLDLAAAGQVVIGVPTAAIAEAQAVLGVNPAMWDHILRFRGLVELPLGAHGALEVGQLARPGIINPVVHQPLTSPLQVAHVLHEALGLAGIVVTNIPEAYGGHPEITIHSLASPPGPGPAAPAGS